MTITLNAAQAMIEPARAHATSLDVPMNIAVTDGGGHLLAFARMDGAILGSIDIRPGQSQDIHSLQRFGGRRQLNDRWSGASAEANDCERLRPPRHAS
jgi:uncharacterized protein GlcG (DUF336 family)